MTQPVRVFVAERSATAMSPADLHSVHAALSSASERLTGLGQPVQLLRSAYLPDQRRWMGVFSAALPEFVSHAVEIAQLPAAEISPAFEVLT